MRVKVNKDLVHIKQDDIVKAFKSPYHKDTVAVWDRDGIKYLSGIEYDIVEIDKIDEVIKQSKTCKYYIYAIKTENGWSETSTYYKDDKMFERHQGLCKYFKTKKFIEVPI